MVSGEGRTLGVLAAAVEGELVPPTAGNVLVHDVSHDSRNAGPGVLFVAIPGTTVDGHHFAGRAVDSGATGICVERSLELGVPEIRVPETRAVLGRLASEVHGNPSHTLSVVGVTGTNGKTTVTHYLESIAASAGVDTGLIGTIETRIGQETIDSTHTTPEATDFQRLLARMRDRGVHLVATEVSSHALELGRVSSTRFSVGAFTNLSQDHLDFHGDMDAYGQAKKRLFTEYEVGTAVINVDDPAGRLIASEYSGAMLTVGQRGDIRRGSLRATPNGTAFLLEAPQGSAEVEAPVVGSFNVDNAVLAAACALVSDIGFGAVVEGMQTLKGVPGRFEVVSGDDPIRVVVDYAHTPEGIDVAIEAARDMNPNRIIALIGAGGDRDTEKRPLMGAAVSAADLAIVTSDNPRSEDPDEIIRAVTSGLESGVEAVAETDRAVAIDLAIGEASDGDVVLLLGRGHEPMQEIAGRRIPFDDRDVAREALRRRRSAGFGNDSGRMAQ